MARRCHGSTSSEDEGPGEKSSSDTGRGRRRRRRGRPRHAPVNLGRDLQGSPLWSESETFRDTLIRNSLHVGEEVVPIDKEAIPTAIQTEKELLFSGYESATEYHSGSGECPIRRSTDSEPLEYVGSPQQPSSDTCLTPDVLTSPPPVLSERFDENLPVVVCRPEERQKTEEERTSQSKPESDPLNSSKSSEPISQGEESKRLCQGDQSPDSHVTTPLVVHNTNVTYVSYHCGHTHPLDCGHTHPLDCGHAHPLHCGRLASPHGSHCLRCVKCFPPETCCCWTLLPLPPLKRKLDSEVSDPLEDTQLPQLKKQCIK